MVVVQLSLDTFGFEISPSQIPLKKDYIPTNKYKKTKQSKLTDFGIIPKPRILRRR